MNFDIEDRIIFECLHGSYSYGLNIKTSDEDIRGICIPPKPYFLGFSYNFDQKDSWGDNSDKVIYGISKFFKLAANSNPNVLELLFVKPEFIRNISDSGQQLIDNRDAFISKKAYKTFNGYALSQLKRLKTHYRWIKNPPKEAPKRSDYKLPNKKLLSDSDLGAFNKLLAELLQHSGKFHELEPEKTLDWLQLLQSAQGCFIETRYEEFIQKISGFSVDLLNAVTQEKAYNRAYTQWKQYNQWKERRNPNRYGLESKYGYDTKHAMHLIRLFHMGIELLRDHQLNVYREDRDFLLGIRNGSMTYDELIEYSGKQKEILKISFKNSTLPKTPDITYLNTLHQNIIEQYLY